MSNIDGARCQLYLSFPGLAQACIQGFCELWTMSSQESMTSIWHMTFLAGFVSTVLLVRQPLIVCVLHRNSFENHPIIFLSTKVKLVAACAEEWTLQRLVLFVLMELIPFAPGGIDGVIPNVADRAVDSLMLELTGASASNLIQLLSHRCMAEDAAIQRFQCKPFLK